MSRLISICVKNKASGDEWTWGFVLSLCFFGIRPRCLPFLVGAQFLRLQLLPDGGGQGLPVLAGAMLDSALSRAGA